MEGARISKTLMRHLQAYLEYLRALPGGDCNVSATTIASALGMGEVQVRKDLAKIAGSGRCRTGRSRDQLIREMERCIAVAERPASVLVKSSLQTDGIDLEKENVAAIFVLESTDVRKAQGRPVYAIRRLEVFCRSYNVRVGILSVEKERAQTVCDGLIACGIREIRNHSRAVLSVPEGIQVRGMESA